MEVCPEEPVFRDLRPHGSMPVRHKTYYYEALREREERERERERALKALKPAAAIGP